MTEFLTLKRKIKMLMWKHRRTTVLGVMACLAITGSLLLMRQEVMVAAISDNDFWLLVAGVVSVGVVLLVLIAALNE